MTETFRATIDYIDHTRATGLGPKKDFILLPKSFESEEDAEVAVNSTREHWSKMSPMKYEYITHHIGTERVA